MGYLSEARYNFEISFLRGSMRPDKFQETILRGPPTMLRGQSDGGLGYCDGHVLWG